MLRILVWFQWRGLHHDMKSVIGFKTIADATDYSLRLKQKICNENDLRDDEVLTWENTSKSREDFAFYFTICHFLKKGMFLEQLKTEFRL